MPRRDPSTPDPERALMIQCKVCQRLIKELAHYRTELADNEGKLKLQTDPYDIKHYENLVSESRMMVPDAHRRLSLALEQLRMVLETTANDSSPWEETATEILKDHAKEFQRHDVLLATNVDDIAEGEVF